MFRSKFVYNFFFNICSIKHFIVIDANIETEQEIISTDNQKISKYILVDFHAIEESLQTLMR